MWRFILIGILFGVALTQGEIISWYRIAEMFQFQSFHMYGVIGSAVILGAIFLQLAKKLGWQSVEGRPFDIFEYPRGWKRYLIGGTLFGMGWAITGGCPGPLFILVGAGYTPVLVAILGGMLGTILYGVVRKHLPH
ncbi:MAG: YeeE/YedE family protein [Flavobacteriales bacterium]